MTAGAAAAPRVTAIAPARRRPPGGARLRDRAASAAAVAVYLCLVGIVPVFHARPLINGVISLGQMALVLTFLAIPGCLAARRGDGAVQRDAWSPAALAGAIAGAALSAAGRRRQRRRPARRAS